MKLQKSMPIYMCVCVCVCAFVFVCVWFFVQSDLCRSVFHYHLQPPTSLRTTSLATADRPQTPEDSIFQSNH
jgi:hypothetical protein